MALLYRTQDHCHVRRGNDTSQQLPSALLDSQAGGFVHAYIETGNGCEAYRRSYNAQAISQAAIEVEACRLLQHPKVHPGLSLLRRQNAERLQITVDHVTQMLLEDRARAHARGQSSPAASATMGLAKLHVMLQDKKSDEAPSDTLYD